MPTYTADEVLRMMKAPILPTAKPLTAKPGKVLSIADVQKMQPSSAKPLTVSQRWENAKSDVKDFVVSAAKTYEKGEQAGLRHPVDYSWGMAKGMLSGLVDLGGLAVEGVSGGAKALLEMKHPGENFQSGMDAGKKLVNKIAPTIQKHLQSSGPTQDTANQVLGMIPQAIQAAGDTGFDLTGSPFVGAATQAVGTLVSLLGMKGLTDPIAALRHSSESAKPVERPLPSPSEELSAEFEGEDFEPDEPAPATKHADEYTPPRETNVKEINSGLQKQLKDIEDEKEEIESRMSNLTHDRHESGLSPGQADAQREALAAKHMKLEEQAKNLQGRITPASKPAAVVKPQEKSLEQLTAELWNVAHQTRESLTRTDQNASGESSASLEAQSRVREEESRGRARFLVDPDGKATPLKGVDAADVKAPSGHIIVQANVGANPWTILDRGGLPSTHAQGLLARAGKNLDGALAESKAGKIGGQQRIAPPAKVQKEDPVVFQENGKLVTRSVVKQAFNISDKAMSLPGLKFLRLHAEQTLEEIQRHIAPESLGPEAKAAAAILAKNMAESQMREANYYTKSAVRRSFWNSRMDNAADFIHRYEKGGKFDDPVLQNAADAYRGWNTKIANQDTVDHIEYEPVDNYLFHAFENGDEVKDFLGAKYRGKWGDPGFTKDRVFDLYDQAIKAGFKPKYTNPEDIMLARQHASDIAHMRIQALRDLADAGLAVQIRKGMKGAPDGFASGEFRAPNGERYWVNNKAAQILHNAWNTKSLWQSPGVAGKTFRGAMFLKNALIPFKLGFSLFHPLHVATIDNATGMVRASKELLSGTKSPTEWMRDILKSATYVDSIGQTRAGYRLINLWKGKVPEGELTDVDRQSLQWMVEGGFVPEMPVQYRTGALAKFKDAVQRHSATAAWHAPFAVIDAMQKPLFQVWIPSLKSASFLSDVKTAIAADPTLLDNPLKRQIAFRKLAKSVDNRYGEMAYSTLFWNRWMKDVAVANTLSLGWQLGFLREYGGAASDLGETLTKKGSLSTKTRAGLLDRPLFSLFYTTQALAYGGLLTWAMTGKPPTQLLDYVYPNVGTDREGKTKRVSTMFYPREFWAIAKHVQNQGLLGGAGDLVRSKSSGVLGLTAEWATGVNGLGQEIRDPNSPPFQKLEQTLANSLSEFEPISLEAIKRGGNPVMSTLGFTPAPRYITETKSQSLIQRMYDKYYQGKETPYDRVQKSKDMSVLRQSYADADQDKFDSTLEKMRDKFQLSPNEEQRIVQSLNESKDSAYVKMFKRLSWQEQKQALDKMTADERETYLPVSNVDHLRYSYIPPGDQQ
jgi:hypothetical protein